MYIYFCEDKLFQNNFTGEVRMIPRRFNITSLLPPSLPVNCFPSEQYPHSSAKTRLRNRLSHPLYLIWFLVKTWFVATLPFKFSISLLSCICVGSKPHFMFYTNCRFVVVFSRMTNNHNYLSSMTSQLEWFELSFISKILGSSFFSCSPRYSMNSLSWKAWHLQIPTSHLKAQENIHTIKLTPHLHTTNSTSHCTRSTN